MSSETQPKYTKAQEFAIRLAEEYGDMMAYIRYGREPTIKDFDRIYAEFREWKDV